MVNRRMKSKNVFSWTNPKLKVNETAKYGRGVFAKENIKKDELLVIFGGYAVHLEEFYKLSPKVMHYLSQISDDFVFGIKKISELEDACYFNHSCNPNAGYKGQIFLVAMRKIKKGEEITFDYAMELSSSKISNPKDVDRFDEMKCNCGANNCRKIIRDDDWKIPKLQKKYDGYFQWYIQNKINEIKKKNGF
ncbi:MAG TPA: SET domain-containing protein [Candidatus Moranbacteria bacterium]|nr:SET domain-containing protein [Candidatus Moranbacteria bacterium]